MTQTTNEQLILTYAVLTGLTPLIPVPFVDDLARTYFRRRLVQALAEAHGQNFVPGDVQILADEKGSSCLLGCLGTAFIYPLKFLFRKVFFFLEWKRAIDTASATYYHGFLLDYALQQNWIAPHGRHDSATVRAAIDDLIEQTDSSVINRAMRSAFAHSKGILRGAVTQMTAKLRGAGKQSTDVSSQLQNMESQEKDDVQGVVSDVQQALDKIPSQHFDDLRRKFAATLNESV